MAANKKLKILKIDPWLEPYENDLEYRLQHYLDLRRELVGDDDLASFANGYMMGTWRRRNASNRRLQ